MNPIDHKLHGKTDRGMNGYLAKEKSIKIERLVRRNKFPIKLMQNEAILVLKAHIYSKNCNSF